MISIKDIKNLQENLIDFGLVDPPVDGVLGIQTQNAVKIFSQLYSCENSPKAVLEKIVDCEPPTIKPVDEFTSKVIDKCERLGFWLSRGVDAPNIIYIEGANPDGTINNNRINKWNDLRALLVIEHNGKAYLKHIWRATVNSGQYYTDNPLNPHGAANIEIPLQIWGWSIGWHKTSSLNQEALVQVKPVPVRRDRDKNGRTENDKLQDWEIIGLNQHSGKSSNVDRWSAGCLVVYEENGDEEYQEKFIQELKNHRAYKKNNSYIFPTILLTNEFLN